MKRAFSFRNPDREDPPIEPLPVADGASAAPHGGPRIQPAERDLEVVPEGGRFGELLVRKQLVSRGAIMEALLQQTGSGKRLGDLLVDAGAITDRQLAETLAEQLNIPLADLRNDRPERRRRGQAPRARRPGARRRAAADRGQPLEVVDRRPHSGHAQAAEGRDRARDRPARSPRPPR